MAAGDTTKIGFDTDDGDQDFGGYPGALTDVIERVAIFLPKIGPRSNTFPSQENQPVFGPVQCLFSRLADLLDN